MTDIRTALDSLHDRLHETVKRADVLRARADAIPMRRISQLKRLARNFAEEGGMSKMEKWINEAGLSKEEKAVMLQEFNSSGRADADWGRMASINNAWSQKDERLAQSMAAQEWSEAQVRAFCEKNEWGADRTRRMIEAFKKADAAFGRSDASPPKDWKLVKKIDGHKIYDQGLGEYRIIDKDGFTSGLAYKSLSEAIKSLSR